MGLINYLKKRKLRKEMMKKSPRLGNLAYIMEKEMGGSVEYERMEGGGICATVTPESKRR